jgi:hypothetical protein
MSSFFAQMAKIDTSTTNNPHSQPTPVERSAAERLLLEQLDALMNTANDPETRARLEEMMSEVGQAMENPEEEAMGVPQSFLDELERVPKKSLKKSDKCPICAEPFLDDEYPLVVVLPCHKSHKFDLECVGPWLMMRGTCPMDRKDVMKKVVLKQVDDEEDDELDSMYA